MTTDQLALTKGCSPFGLLVLADYLEESGDTFHAREFRLGMFTDTAEVLPKYGYGDGLLSGNGYGGNGYGSGDGYGYGDGNGYGDGEDAGFQNGNGGGFPY